MPSVTLRDTLALCCESGRVCPQPAQWSELYELLPGRRSDGYGAIPAAPLVAAAWAETGDMHKVERLREHLEWAERHGALDAVHAYLASLDEAGWHHFGD